MPATTPMLFVPPHLTIIRFDPPASDSQHPAPFRLINDEDKAQMTALLDEMRADIDRCYIVDLTGKSFCGTMRLGNLLRLQQVLRASGRVLRIAADQRELLDVFRLTRLNIIMPLHTSLAEAVADAMRPI